MSREEIEPQHDSMTMLLSCSNNLQVRWTLAISILYNGRKPIEYRFNGSAAATQNLYMYFAGLRNNTWHLYLFIFGINPLILKGRSPGNLEFPP
jgi:hypothetical protein